MAGKTFTNQQVAQILREVAAAFEVKGDDQGTNQFRIRAYQTAADSIEHSQEDLKSLWQRNKLTSLEGIGPNLASHLDELFKTGQVKHFTQVKKSLPAGMFPLLTLPGIGPKTAYKLAKNLKLTSAAKAINKLKKAAKEGKISALEGFAKQSEQDILTTLKTSQPTSKTNRMRLDRAHLIATEVIDFLRQSSAIQKISSMGSLRRRNSTVGDIDIGVATDNPGQITKLVKQFPKTKSIIASGENLVRFNHENGQQIDIKIVKPASYGSLLQHFTGSKAHNIHLRELAVKQKLSLSEYGIKVRGKLKTFSDEHQFYAALGLDWIPPELREDRGEIEAAKSHTLPQLITLKDIQGDLHTHTNYDWISSHDDADYSIQDLIQEVIKLNYQYIAIGDHNPSMSSYSPDKIITEIKKRNNKIEQEITICEKKVKKRAPKILKSLEVDIRPDGTLAIPQKAIDNLDFIVVSVHSTKNMNKTVMTKRILKALQYPKVKILGHPTGRLFPRRPGYELDWEPIFNMCLKRHISIEINAHPARLDINDQLVKEAIGKKVKISINTDSHTLADLKFMNFGVDTARRGWATKPDVVNTFPWTKLQNWLKI